MRIRREDLLRQLEAVTAGLTAGKETVEQSSCFVFRQGLVYTYNDEVACRGPCLLGDGFEGAVPAGKLLDLLRKLTEQELGAAAVESGLELSGRRKRAVFRREADVAPHFESVRLPKRWTPLPQEFGDAVSLVRPCAGTALARPETSFVHLHPDFLEATDDYQLCRWRLKTGVRAPALVRQSSLAHVMGLAMTELGETEGWVHFRNQDQVVLSCRCYADEYPDLAGFLEVEGEPAELPEGLAAACEKAALFAAENPEDRGAVLVRLKPGKVRVTGVGVSGSYTELRDIEYQGRPLEFLISPDVMAGLAAKKSKCVVAPERLLVKGRRFRYVTCLMAPTNGNGRAGGEGSSDE